MQGKHVRYVGACTAALMLTACTTAEAPVTQQRAVEV